MMNRFIEGSRRIPPIIASLLHSRSLIYIRLIFHIQLFLSFSFANEEIDGPWKRRKNETRGSGWVRDIINNPLIAESSNIVLRTAKLFENDRNQKKKREKSHVVKIPLSEATKRSSSFFLNSATPNYSNEKKILREKW